MTHDKDIGSFVERRLVDGVLWLTMNNTERRNCLSDSTLLSLQEGIDEAASSTAIHAVVITAIGPVFSSGHDLREINTHREDPDGGVAYFKGLMQRCSNLMKSIVSCPKPIIAEVKGIASAAGCQLVASCDLAYAAQDARFATPGVNIGLFCSTPMVALSRNVHRKHAMEMLLTGEMITAPFAEKIGLINRVVTADKLRAVTEQTAHKIASKSLHVIKTGKQAFNRQSGMSLEQAYETCSEVMVENLMFPDAREGIDAFLTKRQPHWANI